MRTIVRLSAITCALLFGIPAGALLLAHMGFIALPADPYLSSVDATSAPATSYNRELDGNRLVVAARSSAARAAIVGANPLLPHYQRGVNRPWIFHEPAPDAAHHMSAQVAVCRKCPTGDEILAVRATVDRIYDDRAEVTLEWSLYNKRLLYSRRGDALSPGVLQQRGELTVRLQDHDGRWRAIEAW